MIANDSYNALRSHNDVALDEKRALVGADGEFSKNSLDGARRNAERYSLKIAYDRTYPAHTVDFGKHFLPFQLATAGHLISLLVFQA
jgi:hypothetical protein